MYFMGKDSSLTKDFEQLLRFFGQQKDARQEEDWGKLRAESQGTQAVLLLSHTSNTYVLRIYYTTLKEEVEYTHSN